MKFFFPDSSDQVDPTFDFDAETRSETRVRQRDDRYVHEMFATSPIDGLLVSKSIVEGAGSSTAKFTIAQRQRLLRESAPNYFRLNGKANGRSLETMGDCGAFSYSKEKTPPFSVSSVVEFFDNCDFDYGLSVDHVILQYDANCDGGLPGVNVPPPEWVERQELTLSLAREFLEERGRSGSRFCPVGVAQGWSPQSYAYSVQKLQEMGYDYIAIGGIVPLKTREILASLDAINSIRKSTTKLHLLGVTRTSELPNFHRYGVVSFDSTSSLRQAFKDDKDNYHTLDGAYSAVRVPQVDANPKLQRAIRSGKIDQVKALFLEKACLKALRDYESGKAKVKSVVDVLCEYDELFDGRVDRHETYLEILEERPWAQCPCDICKTIGYHVILFRGAERNRRRGFHNIYVFRQRLDREIALLQKP